MFFLGAYYHKKGSIYGVRDTLQQNYRVPLNYLSGLTSRPPHLVIDIKHKHYQRLAYNREIALERGALLPDARDEVPAFLRFENQMIKARIRLKGDLGDHWRDDKKWSFRIRTRGEKTLFGMKQFSIQHPRTRGFLVEWFLHRLLADHGLIALRYDFINVTVNGRYLGLYAVEEHFEKRLIEHNGNREGLLFRADTWFYWYHKPGMAGAIYATTVDAYQTNQLAENPALASQFRVARNLFEAFREGDLETHKVFDVEKFATFFAILDLLGDSHAGGLDNLVFYYNPITSRIEPVAADTGLNPAATLLGASRMLGLGDDNGDDGAADWLDLLFRDPVFFKAYVRELEKISRPELLDGFFHRHEQEYGEKLRILHRSFPWYSFEANKSLLYRNQRFIRNFLDPAKSVQTYARAYSPAARAFELEMASILAMPIEVASVSLANGIVLEPLETTILQPYQPSRALHFKSVSLKVPPELVWDETKAEGLRIHHRILGASHIQQDAVHPWPHRDSAFLANDFIRQPPNFESFEFLHPDFEGKRIYIASGEWRLDRSLIVPPGYAVIGGPGTRLDLTNGAKLLSYSPLELRGSSEDPFIIESADTTGQGLVVLEADGHSVLEHVRFENLGEPEQAGWQLTGAVTFYKSSVTLSHCEFLHSRAEDALNVVRAEFVIDETVFYRSSFDALDVDFGEGRISRTSFVDCGNDGIDVSGTAVELEDILISGAGDKGLSAGERSHMKGSRVTIRGAEIAVASKDLSELILEALEIETCRVGFAVFQKKPEFGPGRLSAAGVSLVSVEVPYLIDELSRASVNGRDLAATHRNVEELLYGAHYGKSSR